MMVAVGYGMQGTPSAGHVFMSLSGLMLLLVSRSNQYFDLVPKQGFFFFFKSFDFFFFLGSNNNGGASSANGPSSSSSVPQNNQILCCAYNANGTVFVTGSSDTFARVPYTYTYIHTRDAQNVDRTSL